MMTKDKKPFSYTPSGLGEIKSPTLARRIQKNANLEGITNDPKPAVTSHVCLANIIFRVLCFFFLTIFKNNVLFIH